MGWEKRNGKLVYYRSQRKGKKVMREYFGSGDAAQLAAALDDCKRRRKRHEDGTVEALRQRWEQASTALDQVIGGTRLLMHTALLAAGKDYDRFEGDCTMLPPDPLIAELQDLVARADAGDASALPRIKQLLEQQRPLTDHFGDIAKVAVECWLTLYAGNNAVLAESPLSIKAVPNPQGNIVAAHKLPAHHLNGLQSFFGIYLKRFHFRFKTTRRKMVAWRASIASPNQSPLEALMIEQVMVCWLQSHYFEAMYEQAIETKASGPILSEMASQQDAGQQRMAASLRQLAELRRLLSEPALETVKLHCPPLGAIQT